MLGEKLNCWSTFGASGLRCSTALAGTGKAAAGGTAATRVRTTSPSSLALPEESPGARLSVWGLPGSTILVTTGAVGIDAADSGRLGPGRGLLNTGGGIAVTIGAAAGSGRTTPAPGNRNL
ncbi:hypothetical protein D3C77_342660 [compost metagenome]